MYFFLVVFTCGNTVNFIILYYSPAPCDEPIDGLTLTFTDNPLEARGGGLPTKNAGYVCF